MRGPHETFQCQPLNQNFYEPYLCYNSISSGFDQFQPPQFPVIHQPPQEMSIQYMEDLKQQYLDEMKSLINEFLIKDYHDEKIDIKINELKKNFNGMSIESNIKKKLQQLDTIPKTESDELIKSSVENLVPFPSESEDFSDIKSECDVPVCDNFTTFSNPLFDADDDFSSSDDESLSDEDVPKEIYSNPFFDEEIISTKIDPHHFNAESDLRESLLNQDTSIISSPKIDSLLEEFSDELAHIDLIPPGINETDFDPEEEIRLVEKLLYDNSSPRPPEEFNSENSDIESFSPFPIPVEDSDSLMEEIDLFLTPDDSMLPVMDDIFDNSTRELYGHVPNVLPNLPTLSLMFDTLLPFSFENDDKVFNHGILASNKEKPPHLLSYRGFKAFQDISDFSESPMMIYGEEIPILDVPIAPDYEASRARGFVLRSLELQSLA
ncbi:hypothetical protein Tco_1079605 [Tanacetum coccineum]|uniref:Uncharacterized protein n=1 Tax=Tanacetum coccineum TaxID=301880 RepID=A0ABQ5HSD9_9ASTR